MSEDGPNAIITLSDVPSGQTRAKPRHVLITPCSVLQNTTHDVKATNNSLSQSPVSSLNVRGDAFGSDHIKKCLRHSTTRPGKSHPQVSGLHTIPADPSCQRQPSVRDKYRNLCRVLRVLISAVANTCASLILPPSHDSFWKVQTMAGLESIALAVAHLERMQKVEENAKVVATLHPPVPKDPPKVTASPPPSRLVRVPFASSPRLVSMEVGNGYDAPPAMASPTAVASTHRMEDDHLQDALPALGLTGDNLEEVVKKESLMVGYPPIPPMDEVISKVMPEDVLCGRGGETNHHSGNKRYRDLVKACQPAYLRAKRREKPMIAKGIVLAVRKVGGRFLKKDPHTSTWRDVGNSRAREKTSQALREGAPEMRTGGPPPSEGGDTYVAEAVKRPVSQPPQLHLGAEYVVLEAESPKRRRTSLEGLANSVHTLSPAPPTVTLPGATDLATPRAGSDSNVVSLASSGDDEDSHGSAKSSRGPRIKLLKSRLQDNVPL